MKPKTCLSIGGGAWGGRTALAAGLSGRINQTFSVRGAASLASGNAGVSAAVGWRLRSRIGSPTPARGTPPACAALHPLPASGRIGSTRVVVVGGGGL